MDEPRHLDPSVQPDANHSDPGTQYVRLSNQTTIPPTQPVETVLALPPSFGRYRIERCLGQGTMGAVYLANDSQLDRPVALKIPKFTENGDSELIERFYREARAAATLRHANLCPVYDAGQIDGIHYLSMAFIEGQPLSEVLAENGHPSARRGGDRDQARQGAAGRTCPRRDPSRPETPQHYGRPERRADHHGFRPGPFHP